MLSASINPKVLGARLQTERKARGLTQLELANLLGFARTTLVAVEKGERALSPEELVRLSEQWNISVSDLVRERAVAEPLVPQLRAAAPATGLRSEDIENIGEAAERLRRWGENYLELESLVGRPMPQIAPPVYTLGAMPPSEAAADIANRERARLGLGDGAIPLLRAVLENEVGLRVFLTPLASRLAGMFAFDLKLGALVALNVLHPKERRLWTLAHEYWHFLCDRYKADVTVLPGIAPRRTSENERMADTFAAHFLMPTSGLKRRFYEIKAARKEGVMLADLLHLKRQYGVTFQALTLRLEELRLIRSGTWESLKNTGFRVGEAEAAVGLPRSEDYEPRLPQRYRELAVEAFERAEISEGQLARFLDCDRIEARATVNELSREAGISDEGEIGALEISLDQPLAEVMA